MNKIYLFVIIVIIFLGSFIGYSIYNYNIEFEKEKLQQQVEIKKIKEQQENINTEFNTEQQRRLDELQNKDLATRRADNDGEN